MVISVVLAGTILFAARRLPLALIEDQRSVQLLGSSILLSDLSKYCQCNGSLLLI